MELPVPSTPGGGNERTSFLLSAVTLGGKIVSELSTALDAVVRLHLTVGVSERSLKVTGAVIPGGSGAKSAAGSVPQSPRRVGQHRSNGRERDPAEGMPIDLL